MLDNAPLLPRDEIIRSRKAKWAEIEQEVETITDALGLPIDEGIKSTVVAFNAVGLSTSASCEGHPECGLLYPYVTISSQIGMSCCRIPIRYEGQEDFVLRRIGELGLSKERIDLADVTDHELELLEEIESEFLDADRVLIPIPNTIDFVKENRVFMKRAFLLLEDFYRDREVDENIRLNISGAWGHEVYISNKVILPEQPDQPTSDQASERGLVDRRLSEMREFGEFLAQLFLSGSPLP